MKKTLYRPTNLAELKLIEGLKWKEFPPRLEGQPIFYPVTNRDYAHQITTEWNLPTYKNGFVVEFDVDKEYASRFPVERVGLEHHTELWVPSEKLEAFNAHILGQIRVIEGYSQDPMVIYYYIEDIFKISGEGIFVGAKKLDEKVDFMVEQLAMIGDVRIEKWMEIPRKLDDSGVSRLNYHCFKLVNEEDIKRLNEQTVVELKINKHGH